MHIIRGVRPNNSTVQWYVYIFRKYINMIYIIPYLNLWNIFYQCLACIAFLSVWWTSPLLNFVLGSAFFYFIHRLEWDTQISYPYVIWIYNHFIEIIQYVYFIWKWWKNIEHCRRLFLIFILYRSTCICNYYSMANLIY